ncbi:MAG: hypothetical protein WD030_09620 [Pirellulales bacterium]
MGRYPSVDSPPLTIEPGESAGLEYDPPSRYERLMYGEYLAPQPARPRLTIKLLIIVTILFAVALSLERWRGNAGEEIGPHREPPPMIEGATQFCFASVLTIGWLSIGYYGWLHHSRRNERVPLPGGRSMPILHRWHRLAPGEYFLLIVIAYSIIVTVIDVNSLVVRSRLEPFAGERLAVMLWFYLLVMPVAVFKLGNAWRLLFLSPLLSPFVLTMVAVLFGPALTESAARVIAVAVPLAFMFAVLLGVLWRDAAHRELHNWLHWLGIAAFTIGLAAMASFFTAVILA